MLVPAVCPSVLLHGGVVRCHDWLAPANVPPPACTMRGRRGYCVPPGVMGVAAAAAAAAAVAAAVTVAEAVAVGERAAVPHLLPSGDLAGTTVARQAAAGPSAGPVVIPFPSPPPGLSAGGLHALPSLQCALHPTAPGGVSPDPEAVVYPYGRGGTGWVYRASPTTDEVVIPYGGGTCASPLNDVAHLSYLSMDEETRRIKNWPYVRDVANMSTGGSKDRVFVWAGNTFNRELSALAKDAPIVNRHIGSEYIRFHPCAAAHGRQTGLLCEEEIVRLLSIHRNQRVGRVDRHRGLYDVLSVARASNGVVLDQFGDVVAAEDRVSDASGSRPRTGRTIVMHTPFQGIYWPVLSGDATLLTLGRGVMANSSWLGGSFPGGISGAAKLVTWGPTEAGQVTTWSLRHDHNTTDGSSRWLQGVANTLCAPPSSSFVVGSGLCDDVNRRKPPRMNPVLAGGRPVEESLGLAAGRPARVVQQGVKWSIDPPDLAGTSVQMCRFRGMTSDYALVIHPMWLFGRGFRELYVTGSAGGPEMELARNLSSCALNDTREDLQGYQAEFDAYSLVIELSQRYRRDVFHVDPPTDPVSDTDVFLTLLVIVPEVFAIGLVLLQRHTPQQRRSRRWWRRGLSVVLVVAAGVVALIGIAFLDRQEHEGHAWRAAAVRYSRRIPYNGTEDLKLGRYRTNFYGRVVTDNETLLIIARTGYRPDLTRRLFAITTAVYAVLTAAVLGRAAVTAWRRSLAAHSATVERGAAAAEPPRRPRWAPPLFRQTRARAPAATAGGELPMGNGSAGDGGGGDDDDGPKRDVAEA